MKTIMYPVLLGMGIFSSTIAKPFMAGLLYKRRSCNHPDKEMRQNLTEKQIDHMLMDSFPASDPISTY